MEPSFTLWECPPLRARLTRRQCAFNRARAEQPIPGSARRFDASALTVGRQECLTCQGVTWWAERTGRGPTEVLAIEVREELERKDAQRRRMGGVEEGPAFAERRRRRSMTSLSSYAPDA
jgi:hypothetical protein